MKSWQRLSSKTIFKHPRLVLVEDEVELPSGDIIEYLRFDSYHDYPTIIAQNSANKLLMIKEYAYPINRALLQFPDGETLDNEAVEQAAKRELAEETGTSAQVLTTLGYNLHHHRRSDAKNHIILATGLIKSDSGDEADLEEQGISIVWLDEQEIWDKIASGEIIQKNTLAAWAIFQAKRPTT